MNDEEYKNLVEKLNSYLNAGGIGPSVSPTRASGRSKFSHDVYIEANMNLDALTQEKLLMVHTLLHKFYASGGNSKLNKQSIEKLHKKICDILPDHREFDKLDKR